MPHEKLVLICDDDQLIRQHLAKELQRNFFSPLLAANGREAIVIAESNDIDIALIDVNLPDMSGLDLLSIILTTRPDCEVIIITGFGNQEVAIQSLRRGAIDYIEKPIQEETLNAALGRAMERLAGKKELQYRDAILILDDDQLVVKQLKRFLEKEGFDVFGAYDGKTGLEIIAGNKIDVLISDIQMGDMDGITVIRQAKKLYADIEAIIITGQSSADLPIHSLRSGAIDFLTKPIDLDGLLFSVNKAIERIKLNRTRLYRNRELEISREIIAKMNEELERRIEERSLELNRVQSQLFQTSKLATLGEMSAGIAHEINQPLGGIALVSKTLRKMHERDCLTPEEFVQCVDDIDSSVQRISKIIKHMRTFARQDEMKMLEVDVNATIHAALGMLAEQLRLHEIEVRLHLDPELPRIAGEPNQLEQVWLNLIANSRDALDNMKSTETTYQKHIEISSEYSPGEGTVVLSFADNGPGMDEDVKKKAFEPFFTTKEVGKGMGLGLSISFGIINSHGGTIGLISTVGAGTSIHVTLPIGDMHV